MSSAKVHTVDGDTNRVRADRITKQLNHDVTYVCQGKMMRMVATMFYSARIIQDLCEVKPTKQAMQCCNIAFAGKASHKKSY